MIKINLNRTRVSNADESIATQLDDVKFSSRDVILKILLICAGIAGLMVYEKQNLEAINSDVVALNAQAELMRQAVATRGAELTNLKDIEPQAQALNDKLRILREFSKLRLEQLQSLDYLQSVIPDRVWLKSVVFENKRYQILGNSVETVDLSDFQRKLEGGAYFGDVIVVQDRDRPVVGGGKIREFEISARGGVQN